MIMDILSVEKFHVSFLAITSRVVSFALCILTTVMFYS